MTDFMRRALEYIANAETPVSARDFALAIWPDSPGWKRKTGTARGRGMWLAGGSYLGKLAKRGLIVSQYDRVGGELAFVGYVLSDKGRDTLDKEEEMG